MTPDPAPGAPAAFYALGPEFEWLASAWDGFARELAEIGNLLRHIAEAAADDPHLSAESSGLSALESATDRLVRELVEDAARIRRTHSTYEQADANVHAAIPTLPPSAPLTGFGTAPSCANAATTISDTAPYSAATSKTACDTASPNSPPTDPTSDLWHPAEPRDLSETALGTLGRFRRQILARAEHWVTQHVPYNQGNWHEGYRTDCSGYVSMCWGLRDSMVTSTMPQISHRIAKEDLRPGDVLINTDVATGHVILFDRWADYAHNSYVGFELCPQGTLHHVIPYPYYNGFGTYEPYRYNSVRD
ncbi:MAG: hypothetical protein HOV87_14915 [Catenulispora sp.]|nr:hypothetical protein [Catenulispora sp.]